MTTPLPGAVNAANRRAFTLIEMMVAIALAAIIVTVVATAFATGTRIQKQSSAKIEASRSANAVLDILLEDIRTIPAQPVLFISDTEGLDLVFTTMTTFGVPDGVPGTALKVGYYVTEANELMRVSIPAGDSIYTADDTDKLVYGMTQFELRYYSQGQWYDNWDSTDPSNSLQFQRHPDVLEVRMRVVDYDGYLERPGQNPVAVTRLIRVGG